MPKINAPTVREHHENVKAKLVDATERILREGGVNALNAGAVAESAGIARNSIYRYVESVDDLKMLAVERHIPEWMQAIFSSVDAEAAPEVRLVQFSQASLGQSLSASHGWFMDVMNSAQSPAKKAVRSKRDSESASLQATQHRVAGMHGRVDDFIAEQWKAMGAENQGLWTAYTRTLIFESFRRSERGDDAKSVNAALGAAIRGLFVAARECGDLS